MDQASPVINSLGMSDRSLKKRSSGTIKFKAAEQGQHTHCEFCWHKFMENADGIKDCSDGDIAVWKEITGSVRNALKILEINLISY